MRILGSTSHMLFCSLGDVTCQDRSASHETTCRSSPDTSGSRRAGRKVRKSENFGAYFERMSTSVHSPGWEPGMGCSASRSLHLSVDRSPGHLFTLSVPHVRRAQLTPIHGRRFTVHAPTSCVRAVDLFTMRHKTGLRTRPRAGCRRISVNAGLSISENSEKANSNGRS